jgi:hypothetical protein
VRVLDGPGRDCPPLPQLRPRQTYSIPLIKTRCSLPNEKRERRRPQVGWNSLCRKARRCSTNRLPKGNPRRAKPPG